MKVKIERGILRFDDNEIYIWSIGRIYKNVTVDCPIKSDLKMLGVVVDGIFQVVYEFRLMDDRILYGFFLKKDDSWAMIATIQNFDGNKYNSFKEYNLGESQVLWWAEIKSFKPPIYYFDIEDLL